MSDDRTLIVYSNSERVVLQNEQIDKFLELGEGERLTQNGHVDPLRIAKTVKEQTERHR